VLVACARVSLGVGVGVGMLLGVLLGVGGSRVAMLVRVVIIGLAGGRASWASLHGSGLVSVCCSVGAAITDSGPGSKRPDAP